MSQYGGSVYELFSPDKTRGYLYSKFSGEDGATELECYFKDGANIRHLSKSCV
jgi:hypothetical protein